MIQVYEAQPVHAHAFIDLTEHAQPDALAKLMADAERKMEALKEAVRARKANDSPEARLKEHRARLDYGSAADAVYVQYS
ncbi:hypothetical protein N7488_008040 [Penicillium malachiteum]|nr:hypothetical protein N7488_008040 [Penicillium malachiteum]